MKKIQTVRAANFCWSGRADCVFVPCCASLAARCFSVAFGGTAHIMPEWLKGMVGPTLMLWLCAIAYGVAVGAGPDGEISNRSGMLFQVALPLVIASWVTADARKRGKELCYDYDSFVFLAPFIVPIYLFQTRGVRAFLTLLCFVGIWVIAMIPAFVVSVVREFAR